MSDFEKMKQRVARSLADLAETHRKMCDELQRGLVISTGMIEHLGLAIEQPGAAVLHPQHPGSQPVLAEAA